jgi:DNA-binding SARP family transcriptional activator
MKALKAYRELKDCLVEVLGISESEAKQRIITQIHFSQFDIRQARRKS